MGSLTPLFSLTVALTTCALLWGARTYSDAPADGACTVQLTNTVLDWCPPHQFTAAGSSAESRQHLVLEQRSQRRKLLAAIWSCHGLPDSNMSYTPPMRVLVWDRYASWLVPALDRFSSLYGIPLDMDLQPYERLTYSIRADGVVANKSRLRVSEGAADLGSAQGMQAARRVAQPSGLGDVPQQHAVWLHASSLTQQLASERRLMDLGDLLQQAQYELNWLGVARPYRLQLTPYGGRTVAMPLDGTLLHMFYRTDVMDSLRLTQVPQTWTQLVEFAVNYGALAADPSAGANTMPQYPLCIARGTGCQQVSYLQAVWSSIAQTQGPSQPIHFDPQTRAPMFGSAASSAAFRILAQLLAAAAPPEPQEGCDHGSLAFARGRCALALAGFVPQMRLLFQPEANEALSVEAVRVAALPGSELILESSSGGGGSAAASLSLCSPSTCPYARRVTASTRWFGAMPASGTGGGGSGAGRDAGAAGGLPEGTATATRSQQQVQQEMLVNFAPQAPGSLLMGGVNDRAPLLAKLLGFELLSFLASSERYGMDEAGQPLQHVFPVRAELLQSDSIDVWQAAGYGAEFMADSLSVLSSSLMHPNVAWGLRMPRQGMYNQLIGDTVAALQSGNITADPWVPTASRPSTSVREDGSGRMALPDKLARGNAALASYYGPAEYELLYVPSLAPWLPAPPRVPCTQLAASAQGGGDGSKHVMYLVPALLGTILPLMLGCLAVFAWRHMRRSRSSAGCLAGTRRYSRKMHVPAAGLEVVLCVTDIQDSTALWENLPADVVARAVDIHHRCVRRLALRHGGYESATEGDSFILAFSSVRSTVSFALELQSQLLIAAPWPNQLLEQEVCKPVHTHLPAGYPFSHTANSHVHTLSPRTRRMPWGAAPPPEEGPLANGSIEAVAVAAVAGLGVGGGEDGAERRMPALPLGPGPPFASHPRGLTSHQLHLPPPVPLALNSCLGAAFIRGRSLGDLVRPALQGAAAGTSGTLSRLAFPAFPATPSLVCAAASNTLRSAAWCSTDLGARMGTGFGPDETDTVSNMLPTKSYTALKQQMSWPAEADSSSLGPLLPEGMGGRRASLTCRTVVPSGSLVDDAPPPPPVSSETQAPQQQQQTDSELLPAWGDSGLLVPTGYSMYTTTTFGTAEVAGMGANLRLWDDADAEGASSASNAICNPAHNDVSPSTANAVAASASAGRVGAGGCRTLQDVLQLAATRVTNDGRQQQQQQQQLVFRGLRVRVGISVAVPTAAEVQYNTAAARMVYGGPSVAACKVLADLAHGGQVFLSARAHRALAAECQGLGGKPPGTMVLQMGLMETTPPPGRPSTSASDAPHQQHQQHPMSGGGASFVTPSCVTSPTSDGCRYSSDALALFSWRSGELQSPLPRVAEHHSGSSSKQLPLKQYQQSLLQARQLLALEPVYWVTALALSPRMALVPPPRFPAERPPAQDVYRAPLGRVSYAVVRVPAAAVLLRWSGPVAAESMRLFVHTAISELRRAQGGYLVSASPAEVRAAFPSPVAAVAWALHVKCALLRGPWPQELLQHELGEPVEAFEGLADGVGSLPASETGTPRLRWSSLAAFSRASSREGSTLRTLRGGLAGSGGTNTPTAGANGAAGWEGRRQRSLHQHHRRYRGNGPRGGSPSGAARAELNASSESDDGEQDKLEPLSRTGATAPLRRHRHSIDSFLPVAADGHGSGSLGPRPADMGGGSLGYRHHPALAELAKHVGRGVRTATGSGGGSVSASGYLAAPPSCGPRSRTRHGRSTTTDGTEPMRLRVESGRSRERVLQSGPQLVALSELEASEAGPGAGGEASSVPSRAVRYVDSEYSFRSGGGDIQAVGASADSAAVAGMIADSAPAGARGAHCGPFPKPSGRAFEGHHAGALRDGALFSTMRNWADSIHVLGDSHCCSDAERVSGSGGVSDSSGKGGGRAGTDARPAQLAAPGAAAGGGGPPAPSQRSPAASAPMPLLPFPQLDAAVRQQQAARKGRLLLRGLRIHVGIATGTLDWTVSSKTHALVYTGRAVSRAARLSDCATSGKVLCDKATHRGIIMAQQALALASPPPQYASPTAREGGCMPSGPLSWQQHSQGVSPREGDERAGNSTRRRRGLTDGQTYKSAGDLAEAEMMDRVALELQLVRQFPPAGNRLTMRAADEAFLCEFASDAAPPPRLPRTPLPSSPPTAHTPLAAAALARGSAQGFWQRAAGASTGGRSRQQVVPLLGSSPGAPVSSPALVVACGSGSVTEEIEQATTPRLGRPPPQSPPLRALGTSDNGVEQQASRTWGRKQRFGSCPGLDLSADECAIAQTFAPTSAALPAERTPARMIDGHQRSSICSTTGASDFYSSLMTSSGVPSGSLQSSVPRLSPGFRASTDQHLPYIICERVDEEGEASDDGSGHDDGDVHCALPPEELRLRGTPPADRAPAPGWEAGGGSEGLLCSDTEAASPPDAAGPISWKKLECWPSGTLVAFSEAAEAGVCGTVTGGSGDAAGVRVLTSGGALMPAAPMAEGRSPPWKPRQHASASQASPQRGVGAAAYNYSAGGGSGGGGSSACGAAGIPEERSSVEGEFNVMSPNRFCNSVGADVTFGSPLLSRSGQQSWGRKAEAQSVAQFPVSPAMLLTIGSSGRRGNAGVGGGGYLHSSGSGCSIYNPPTFAALAQLPRGGPSAPGSPSSSVQLEAHPPVHADAAVGGSFGRLG